MPADLGRADLDRGREVAGVGDDNLEEDRVLAVGEVVVDPDVIGLLVVLGVVPGVEPVRDEPQWLRTTVCRVEQPLRSRVEGNPLDAELGAQEIRETTLVTRIIATKTNAMTRPSGRSAIVTAAV